MRVIIKEREYEYLSDYNDGWEFSAGDFFKFPVNIGNHPCFIKRFARSSERIAGWNLLNDLKGRFQPGLPRIHDIVLSAEQGKDVQYVFFECMEGDTLDRRIGDGEVPDPAKLAADLFRALASIHRQAHWFPDFCDKNIFCAKEGGFLLIDLDSAQPSSTPPDTEIYASKEYWAPAFSFFIGPAGLPGFRPRDISGILLNYLQAVFLILRVRVGLIDGKDSYKSTELLHRLPRILDSTVPEYRSLFLRLVKNGPGIPDPSDIAQIRTLLDQRIVNGNIVYPDGRDAGQGAFKDTLSRPVSDPAPAPPIPVISGFRCDKKRLAKGGTFTLAWEMEHAESILLYRDEMPYKKPATADRDITLTERYDGKRKKVVYSLSASNASGNVNSRQLVIDVGPGKVKPIFLLIPAVAILTLLLVFFYWKAHAPDDALMVADKTGVSASHDTATNSDWLIRYEDSLNRVRMAIIEKNRRKEGIEPQKGSIKKVVPPPVETKQADKDHKGTARRDAKEQKSQEQKSKEQKSKEQKNQEQKSQDTGQQLDHIPQSGSASDTQLLGLVKVITSNYKGGFVKLKNLKELVLLNQSTFWLENADIQIIQGPDHKMEERILNKIPPGSTTVLENRLPKDFQVEGKVIKVKFMRSHE
jgi:hypothetical protein